MKNMLHKRDVIFLAVIALIGIVGLVFWYFGTRSDTALAQITVDGELYGTYPLDTDTEISIENDNDTVTNIVVIKDGEVYMKDATCPDQLCMHQGKKSRDGASIVCLPNKVVVTVEADNAADDGSIDTIAQ